MYIITARRITSGELLKQRKGLFIGKGYERLLCGSSRFSLKTPSPVSRQPTSSARRSTSVLLGILLERESD